MKHKLHKDRKSFKKWALPSVIPKPSLVTLKATNATRKVEFRSRGAFGAAMFSNKLKGKTII